MKFKIKTWHLLYIVLLQIVVIDIVVIGFFLNKAGFFQKKNNNIETTGKVVQINQSSNELKQPAANQNLFTGQASLIFSKKENSTLKHDPVKEAFLSLNRFSKYKNTSFILEYYLSPKKSFIATAYDLSYKSSGKYPSHPEYGITFSGIRAKKGRTVAVDPAVVPIGSYIKMEFPMEYSYLNGWYIAEDTGNLVKGNIIDVFFGEKATVEAMRFGRRQVEARVIYPQDVKKLLQYGISYITINGNR